MRMLERLGKLVRDDRAATAIEYGLIVSLIVCAIIAGVSALGGQTGSMWTNMAAKVSGALI
jgi:pilus assembly protein Flp/PilA